MWNPLLREKLVLSEHCLHPLDGENILNISLPLQSGKSSVSKNSAI